jgi:EmrB/QacA subfamily drug resistance transporter
MQQRRSDLLLAAVCLAQFMVILDVAIVNIALPSIRDGLGFSATGLEWVVNAYTLTFAGLLMLGGRAADLLGRRRMFIAGIVLFSGASLLCALAQSPDLLIAARALQGIGGAIVSPTSLSIITSSFEEGPERNRALGIWTAVAGLGATSGSVLGGLLTSALGWPAIFLLNLPIGALVLILGRRTIPESEPAALERGHFDLSGALLVTAGLVSLTYGIVRTDSLGWGAPGVLGPLAAGAALLGLFTLVEGRLARVPLIPLGVFRIRVLRTSNLVVLLLYSAQFAMFFFLTLYMQQVLGMSALEAGLGFAPLTLAVVAGSSIAPRLVARFGVRAALTVGMLSGAAGLALLSGVDTGGDYVSQVLPGGVLATLGLGLSLVPATIGAVQGVERSQSGLASGLLNTSRLLGGALGLAVLGTLAASHTHHLATTGSAALPALTAGFQLAFQLGALLCLAGALSAAVMMREPRPVTLAAPATSLPE